MKEIDFTKGKVNSNIIRFAVPFLLAFLLQACYGAADLIITGKLADSVQQSGVATGTQIMNFLMNFIIGMTTGTTIIMGNLLGRKKRDEVKYVIGTSFVVLAVFAAGFTLLFTLGSGFFADLLNAPEEARECTQQYIFICACGIIFIIGYNAIAAVLRGMGDSKTPLIFVAIACAINIVLDIVLVSAGLGASGAAIATITAQGVSMIIAIIYLKKKNFIFDFRKESFKTDRKKVSDLLKVSIPVAFQNIIVNISFIIIAALANTYGVAASAAIGINEKFNMFFMLPAMVFSMATATAVAQNMGAEQIKRAKKTLWTAVLYSLAFGITFFLLLRFIPDALLSIFTNDPAVVEQAELYISSFSWDLILVAVVFCLNGFVNGVKKTNVTLASNIISTFGVRIPLVFIFSSLAGATLFELGLAAPIATVVQIGIILTYYKMEKWNPERELLKNGGVIK